MISITIGTGPPLSMILFALVLMSAVSGLSVGTDPKPCCMNHRFSGVLMQVGVFRATKHSTPRLLDDMILFDYDYDAKKIRFEAQHLEQSTGQRTNVTTIEDYTNSTRYTLTHGRCFASPLDPAAIITPCGPANSTFVQSYTQGSGNSLIHVNIFKGMIGQMVVYMHRKADDCTPIAQSTFGKNPIGEDTMFVTNFGDVNLGSLYSPTAFDVPDICRHAAPLPDGKRSTDAQQPIPYI